MVNLAQIREYVEQDKPIAGTVAKDWLRYLLHRVDANERVLKYADNEIESAFNLLREDSFENAEDAGETLGKVHLTIRSILKRYEEETK